MRDTCGELSQDDQSVGMDQLFLQLMHLFLGCFLFREIPDDSDASILTAGLLGSQYIGLQAGGSDTFLENGSEIYFTQSAIVLEKLIGKFLVSSGSGGDE